MIAIKILNVDNQHYKSSHLKKINKTFHIFRLKDITYNYNIFYIKYYLIYKNPLKQSLIILYGLRNYGL